MDIFETIKIMDREEMAEFIAEVQYGAIKQVEENYNLGITPADKFVEGQTNGVLNWLSREV